MTFPKTSESEGIKCFTSWQGQLEFIVWRYDDDTPDALLVWDHATDTCIVHKDIPKPR